MDKKVKKKPVRERAAVANIILRMDGIFDKEKIYKYCKRKGIVNTAFINKILEQFIKDGLVFERNDEIETKYITKYAANLNEKID